MVYSHKFVCSLKVNGQILRDEHSGLGEAVVRMPFSSEYTILLKNLESRDAVAKLTIDGKNVFSDGSKVIVPANQSVELEGWADGSEGHSAFRFIQKTEKIQQHRGDNIDDGILRCEFQYVKRPNLKHSILPYWPDCPKPYGRDRRRGLFGGSHDFFDVGGQYVTKGGDGTSNSINASCLSNSPESYAPQEDEGITVEGTDISQSFNREHVGPLELHREVIIIRITGYDYTVESKPTPVSVPVTVKTKKTCPNCGTKHKWDSKFCSECSTKLRF